MSTYERLVNSQNFFSPYLTQEELNELGRKTVNKKNWSASSVLTVLRNEKYVGDIEMQKTITKDFLTHRSTINKGEAPRYYVENHHVGIIDRSTWDKAQTMLYEKPSKVGDSVSAQKKKRGYTGSPFGNLVCGAVLEHGERAGKECGEGFFRVTYTGVATGYTDDRSIAATGGDTDIYLEKYAYAYPVWRCKQKMGKREGEKPRQNGTPDQKRYCREKHGRLSDAERKAANERCPSESIHTEADFKNLQRIVVLTKSGLTCGDIKKLQAGEIDLEQAIRERKQYINDELERKRNALKMLDNLLDDSAEFETFQTQHYWDIISEKEAAGEEFIDIEDMYGYRPVSLERAVKCPHCGHEENVDLEDFMYDESSYEKENGMGPDLVYSFNSEDCYECPECGHTLKIEGWIREYPMGAYDSEDIKVEDCGGDEDDE